MENLTTLELPTIKSIVEHATNKLSDLQGSNIYGCDLHNSLFNEDYFIIGYYQAEQWLINNGGVFNAIGEISEYEKSNFGEINTDLSSSEKVANMYAYILGEIVLQESKTLQDNWDNHLTDKQLNKIAKELSKLTN